MTSTKILSALCLLLRPVVLVEAHRGHLRQLTPFDPKTVELKQEGCQVKPGVDMLSQYREDEVIFEKFYSNPPRCGGTVLEMGAYDGKTFSNSWYFEHALGWTPILIEASPENFKWLKSNRPNAINIFGAMCMGDAVRFQTGTHGATGGVAEDMSEYHVERWTDEETGVVDVPCYLLADVFRKNQIKHVDVFFLDVEGGELTVLQTMDWDVQVDVWVIEMDGTNPKKDEAVRAVLRAHGYGKPFNLQEECIKRQDECMNSEVFAHKDFMAARTSTKT